MFSWPDLLTGLVRGDDLDSGATSWAMNEILAGNATPVQIAGFAVALRAKGESVPEISGMAEAMLDNCNPIELSREAVDVVGTGGDRANTVNISTMASVVAAAAGARVVKHGNRAASSMCGTADCLEALGLRLDVPAAEQPAIFDEFGIVFLFAPHYHPSLRHASVARRELGISTTFNFLGPLSNPARPLAAAVGVADRRMAPLMAGVLAARGARGMIFHGGDGLDELTTTTDSDVWLIADGRVVETSLDPLDLGIPRATRDDLLGGDPAHNARVARETFAGASGPVRDIVAVNASAALLAYEGPNLDEDLLPQFQRALGRVSTVLEDGTATALLDRWVAATQRTAQ